ncbi:MAG: hypothetical protein KTR21_04615 [Rhodobacteraceae bacterium]|nr:hypothetical protein [Paracoccaceae bacterium]
MTRTVCMGLAAIAALTVMISAAGADEARKLLFDTAHLASVAEGERVFYRHRVERDDKFPAIVGRDERILLAATGPKTMTVTLDADGVKRELDPFRGGGNNPVMLVFLESVVRAVSRVTGGSPFYLRRRVQEAFQNGAEVEETPDGRSFGYRPFSSDQNRAKLGSFADLEIRFTLSDAVPGAFVQLAATAMSEDGESAAYLEEITHVQTP